MTAGATRRTHVAPQAQVFGHEPHEPHERVRADRDTLAEVRKLVRAFGSADWLRSCGSWLILAAITACAPKPATHGAEPQALDCSQTFEVLAHRVTGQPGLTAAPKDPAEPYRFYSSEDGATSYLVTEPGAPGHPAIMMQRAQHKQVVTTGCPYGDRKGYAQLLAYLDSLKAWTRR